MELASRAEVGGVILQSTFTSCIRVAYDVKNTAFDVFCNVKKIHKVAAPVFIVHGTEDEVVAISHGKVVQENFFCVHFKRKFIFLSYFY